MAEGSSIRPSRSNSMRCLASAKSASILGTLAKLCGNLVLDLAQARRPRIFQCSHLAGDALGAQQQFWRDHYNREHHFAHRARQDGRHSPSDVLRGVLDARTRKKCSRGCSMPRSLPVILTSMATSASGTALLWRRWARRGRGLRVGVRKHTQNRVPNHGARTVLRSALAGSADHGSNQSSPPGNPVS